MRRLALVLLLVLVGCERSQPEYWQGYIEGEYVLLASPQAGQLQKLEVRRGNQVERGAPVFVLEQEAERAARREAEERLRSAQARLQNLETGRRPAELDALRAEVQQAAAARTLSASQLAQEEKLFKGGFISQARLDEARTAHERDVARLAQAQAQLANAQQPLGRDAERKAAQGEVAAARAALAQAQWRLEQKSIAAPVSGLVQDTFFVEGEWVAAGRPVASILPPGNVKARFYVPQAVLGRIAVGAPVEIRCDGCAAPVAAQVSYLSAQAEYTPPVLYSREGRAKLVYLVEARPAPGDAAQLRPGQPIEVVPLPR
jgi:HlyD family secretion protein